MQNMNRRDVLKLTPVAAMPFTSSSDTDAEPSLNPPTAVTIRLRVGENCWIREGTNWHRHKEVSPYTDVDITISSGRFHLGLRFGQHSHVHFPEDVGGPKLTDVVIHATRSDDGPGTGKKKRRHVKLKPTGDVDAHKDEDTAEMAVFIEPWYDGQPWSELDPARACCVSCGDTTVCGPPGATCIMCNGMQICC